MTLTSAAALGLAALAGYAAIGITVPGQAGAATAYRYWAYYVARATSTSTTWQYAQRGPATEYPVDGEVQGWRFAVQADAANGLLPRAAPDFGALCASTPAKAGELRVGIVVDFGLATDAPAHERPPAGVVPGCVYVRDGQTGANVLEAAAAVRIGTGTDAGLVCGIDGYPKTECAVVATDHSAAPAARSTPAPARPSPRVTASTPPVPATASAPTTAAAPPASAAQTTIPAQTAIPAQTTIPAQTAIPAQTTVPPAQSAAASARSLTALRSSTRHSHGVHATTIAGIALIVALGAGVFWRTRPRGR